MSLWLYVTMWLSVFFAEKAAKPFVLNHLLFQDGILQDTVSNTTFSQTLNFQGGLTPILCTNQDNNFQYRFFARKINPRIWVPRWKNTKTSWNQDIMLARQTFPCQSNFKSTFCQDMSWKNLSCNFISCKIRKLFWYFYLGFHILGILFIAKIYVGSCCLGWYIILEPNLQMSSSLSWYLLGSVTLHLAPLENSCY